jgi:glycosyltransferase involved in cell wall biosynthesis
VNIVVVSERFHQGGLETHLGGFMREVQRRGHRVSMITGARERLGLVRGSVSGGVLALEWPQPLTAGAALTAVELMAEFCRAQDAHLLHLHPFLTLSLGCLTAARLRLPFVLTLHGPSNLRPEAAQGGPPVLKRIVSAASKVYGVCDEVTDAVRPSAPTGRVSTLPNAVDLARWRPATRDPSAPWAVIARLDADKVNSVRYAVEMLCSVLRGEARVFGDGSERGALERWLADQAWGGRVRLEGHRDDLADVLREGFAGVAGMTRVVLEGGALGLPVMLAGYDGVKGLVEAADMPALSRRNFSGRGLAPIEASALARQRAALDAEPERFQLRPWIEANADESSVWERYLREVTELPAPRLEWPLSWLRSMESAPDQPLFSPETLPS